MAKKKVESQVASLLERFSYCSVQGNCLYWTCGRTSGRIITTDIDSIAFLADKAILHSGKGTDFGYHEVIFTADGASFSEVLDDVFYY